MDKITRYLILLLGFIVFLILAPLIIIYITGANFLQNNTESSNNTGILDIKSYQESVEVFVNNKAEGKTPKILRFLKQGHYDISLQKTGFYPWHKQLFIESGKVTYLGQFDTLIKLLPDQPATTLETTPVVSMVGIKNALIYLRHDNTIIKRETKLHTVQKQTQPTEKISKIENIGSDQYLLAKTPQANLFLLNTTDLTLLKLPEMISKSTGITIQKNTVYAINAQKFIMYNIDKPNITTLLNNVASYAILDNLVYIAHTTTTDSIIIYDKYQTQLNINSILITSALPLATNYTLLVSAHKNLFLQADQSLYKINQQLELLTSQLISVHIAPTLPSSAFSTPTETYLVNATTGKADLLTRIAEPVQQIIVSHQLGYVLHASDSKITATEIDNQGFQNRYTLQENGLFSQLIFDDDHLNLYFLNDQKLFYLKFSTK